MTYPNITPERKEEIVEKYKKEIVSRAVEISPHGIFVLRDFILSILDEELGNQKKRLSKEGKWHTDEKTCCSWNGCQCVCHET